MIRSFKDITPKIAAHCYIDRNADVIGDVEIGEDCSVWPMTVIRGDVNYINIGHSTNIQDGSVLHVSHAGEYNPQGAALSIGNYVTVGHKVLLHACTIGNDCLIGMGSIVMDNVVIEDHVMVGAGTLVPPGKTLDSGHLYLGNPCQKVRALTERELSSLRYSAEHYVRLKNRYLESQ
jgi:carbonic anhydrase/acetyltransferase-like protein (isoleucine patch superfamily)